MAADDGFAADEVVSTAVRRAMEEVSEQQSALVSVKARAQAVRKFGHSDVIDNTGYKTVWASPAENETLPSTNSIDAVSSSSGSDTMDVTIEGFTISAGDLTFVTQDVTLTGQTAAAITALARVTRVSVIGATANVGDIYVHEGGATTAGVPDVDAEVHATVSAGRNQTRKAASATASDEYLFVTRFFASVNRATSAAVDVQLETKAIGGVWKPTFTEIGLQTTGTTSMQLDLDPVLIIPPNTDIRVRAQGSSATNTSVSASFAGYLALVEWSA